MSKLQYRILTYLIGCLLFSIGAKFFINSNLGVDPLDCLAIGAANKLNCKIGTVSAMLAIFFLVIWSIWNKRKPILTPFITMTMVGYLIDFWNYIVPLSESSYSYILLFIGLIICSYSSSLIIMSGIGVRTMDLVAITITQKMKTKFYLSKGIIELGFIISGLSLSGPFGVGTFMFLMLVGPLIQPFIQLNQLFLKIPNYGLRQNLATIELI